MAPNHQNQGMVYSATYSNVPVYELKVELNLVMRRRSDDWINATHILKVANLDKPARTRVLEKEVQLGIHEKVQGGYGKYQGTWVPLNLGVALAKKYDVYDHLQPIFNFTPGDKSPPPAPKHTTAASTKTKVPKAPTNRRIALSVPQIEENYETYENASERLNDDESVDNSTIGSHSVIDDDDYMQRNQFSGSRKRRRVMEARSDSSRQDKEHRLWADSLLDYFMLHDGNTPFISDHAPPTPPENFQVNKTVDNQDHTALHWATAMGDVEVVKDLMKRGADTAPRNIRGETPLIRAGLFANCYDKGTYPKMEHLLQDTITIKDDHGATCLHHVAHTACSGSRTQRARYYLDILLNKLNENLSKDEFYDFVNAQDKVGDTAFHIAARYSRRCTKAFQAFGVLSDIANHSGETVDRLIEQRAKKAKSRMCIPSSSPAPVSGFQNLDSSPVSRFPSSAFSSSALPTKSSQTFLTAFQNLATTKVSSFIQAGEEELQDKDNLLSDTQFALQRTTASLTAVRERQTEVSTSIDDDGADVAALSSEHAQLAAEAEAYEEQTQHIFLHMLIRERENEAVVTQKASGMQPTSDEEMQARLRAAMALHELQEERRSLSRAVLEAQAQAGMGVTGEQCMRVLQSTLGIKKEQIQIVVDELLEDLEMSRGVEEVVEMEA